MNMLPGVISQKIRKKLKTRENKQDNFDFTRKMSVCYLTENLEKFVKFVKLEMTILISRKKMKIQKPRKNCGIENDNFDFTKKK